MEFGKDTSRESSAALLDRGASVEIHRQVRGIRTEAIGSAERHARVNAEAPRVIGGERPSSQYVDGEADLHIAPRSPVPICIRLNFSELRER